MPDPVEANAWITPIIAAVATVGTGAVAVWVRITQANKSSSEGAGIVAVAGTINDSRSIAHLTDQLAENGRSMRDLSRSLVEAERTANRIVDLLEDRVRNEKTEEARMMAIIQRLRGKPDE